MYNIEDLDLWFIHNDFNLFRSAPNIFEPINLGDIRVSIQASPWHYCSPRAQFSSCRMYDSFEVALIVDDEFFHPEKDERFANSTWAKFWAAHDDVAPNVPRSEVANMLKDLKATFIK